MSVFEPSTDKQIKFIETLLDKSDQRLTYRFQKASEIAGRKIVHLHELTRGEASQFIDFLREANGMNE